jgi:acetyl-CoA carboxylase biotin carboxyl carrier protein
MNQKELKELIDFLIEKDISEFELERGDVKVRIKRGGDSSAPVIAHAMPIASMPMPVSVASPTPAAASGSPAPAATSAVPPPAAAEEELHQVKSPIVGTFYESPAPGAPPFVKPGDQVAAGQVLCIIEAMKLMNEIESDVSGEIVRALVNNGQAVEYGQPLFAVRPRK